MNRLHRLQLVAVAVLWFLGAAGARADIVCDPSLLTLTQTIPGGEVVIDYTGGGSANLAGYSLDIVWDNTLATAVFARPTTGPFSAAATFFVVNLASGHVRVDAAIGGADPGIATGELLKVNFTAQAGVVGTSSLDLTILYLRDPLNLGVTGVAAVDGVIDVDTGAPVITSVLIGNDTLVHTDDYVKDTDTVTLTVEVTDDDAGFGAANLTADLTGLGGGAAVAPTSYVAPVATWTLAAVCTPADGTVTVTVTATDAGGNWASASDTIIADNTAPSPLLGVSVAPGHGHLHLGWAAIGGSDANPLGVEFRYAPWGGYPAYDILPPVYPADHNEGALALQATVGGSAEWPIALRDVYYVAGFVYDMVLHYSAPGAANLGRATNYWLGDVAGAAGADGEVDIVNDVTRLANTYGLRDIDGGYDAECDVGPTDTYSPRGIPQPNVDHEIGFEDMMVFALNYTVVTPAVKAGGRGGPDLAWSRIDDTTWALTLMGNGDGLQGLNLRATLPAGVNCTVTPGDLLAAQGVPVFVNTVARRGLDVGLAVFGRGAGVVGAGELVRVAVSAPLDAFAVEVTARDADNRELAVRLAGGSGFVAPSAARFAQNFPNPFNPGTTLTFDLPTPRHVNLTIYGVGGDRVRVLLDEGREAGRYELYWDGLDDQGRSLATGAYFARIVTGDFEQIRKMILVK